MLLADEYWPFRLCVALCRGECKWSTISLKKAASRATGPVYRASFSTGEYRRLTPRFLPVSIYLQSTQSFSFEARREIAALIPIQNMSADAQVSVSVQRPNRAAARIKGCFLF